MARMRMVKKELRTSELIASWPIEQRYFFVMLLGYLDDKGRGLDIPRQIAADCFPHDEKVTPAKVDGWLNKMLRNLRGELGPICRYQVDGRRYLHAVNWSEHQKPNRPTPTQHPPCPIHDKLSEPVQEELSESPDGDSHPLVRGLEDKRGRGVERASALPSPRCAKHENNPTSDPCRGCKDARLLREEYDGQQFRAEQERRAVIHTCKLCDVDGWRYEDDRRIPITPYVKCDHRPLRSVSSA
jgi:hypothetical protein